ncbi:MAG TPA: hypothetical protein HPP54_09755 [Nitrospinae bacterium]|nr:hypothetical protein [Nitrospinota bacterium]
MKKDRQKTKEKKRVQSFNLSDSCIDKLNHLSDITKAHNKSAIVQRLIEHQYIMEMAKREKAQGRILDYTEPHIQTYEQRKGYANAKGLESPRCNPNHMNGSCGVCDELDRQAEGQKQLEDSFLGGIN